MLGNGRPFAIELVNPKRALSVKEEHLIEMEKRINESKDVKRIKIKFYFHLYLGACQQFKVF